MPPKKDDKKDGRGDGKGSTPKKDDQKAKKSTATVAVHPANTPAPRASQANPRPSNPEEERMLLQMMRDLGMDRAERIRLDERADQRSAKINPSRVDQERGSNLQNPNDKQFQEKNVADIARWNNYAAEERASVGDRVRDVPTGNLHRLQLNFDASSIREEESARDERMGRGRGGTRGLGRGGGNAGRSDGRGGGHGGGFTGRGAAAGFQPRESPFARRRGASPFGQARPSGHARETSTPSRWEVQQSRARGDVRAERGEMQPSSLHRPPQGPGRGAGALAPLKEKTREERVSELRKAQGEERRRPPLMPGATRFPLASSAAFSSAWLETFRKNDAARQTVTPATASFTGSRDTGPATSHRAPAPILPAIPEQPDDFPSERHGADVDARSVNSGSTDSTLYGTPDIPGQPGHEEWKARQARRTGARATAAARTVPSAGPVGNVDAGHEAAIQTQTPALEEQRQQLIQFDSPPPTEQGPARPHRTVPQLLVEIRDARDAVRAVENVAARRPTPGIRETLDGLKEELADLEAELAERSQSEMLEAMMSTDQDGQQPVEQQAQAQESHISQGAQPAVEEHEQAEESQVGVDRQQQAEMGETAEESRPDRHAQQLAREYQPAQEPGRRQVEHKPAESHENVQRAGLEQSRPVASQQTIWPLLGTHLLPGRSFIGTRPLSVTTEQRSETSFGAGLSQASTLADLAGAGPAVASEGQQLPQVLEAPAAPRTTVSSVARKRLASPEVDTGVHWSGTERAEPSQATARKNIPDSAVARQYLGLSAVAPQTSATQQPQAQVPRPAAQAPATRPATQAPTTASATQASATHRTVQPQATQTAAQAPAPRTANVPNIPDSAVARQYLGLSAPDAQRPLLASSSHAAPVHAAAPRPAAPFRGDTQTIIGDSNVLRRAPSRSQDVAPARHGSIALGDGSNRPIAQLMASYNTTQGSNTQVPAFIRGASAAHSAMNPGAAVRAQYAPTTPMHQAELSPSLTATAPTTGGVLPNGGTFSGGNVSSFQTQTQTSSGQAGNAAPLGVAAHAAHATGSSSASRGGLNPVSLPFRPKRGHSLEDDAPSKHPRQNGHPYGGP